MSETLTVELSELADPETAAEAAGLRYVNDRDKGILRIREGDGFSYLDSKGKPVVNARTIQRIESLVIPPAWEEVWISPEPNGHIQACGRDAKRRKQYIYHAKWQEIRGLAKFEKMIAFGEALPRIREQVEADLRRRTLGYEKVMALIVRLLEHTMIRIGNDEYARNNKSHGLTTIRDEHVDIDKEHIRFIFRGKSGKQWHVGLRDRRLAKLIRQCQELPGQDLFQYLDENGEVRDAKSEDVNRYLRDISGQDFTAKDFRTWWASVIAARSFIQIGAGDSPSQNTKRIRAVVKEVAHLLSNTPTVCRKHYIHPGILESYEANEFCDSFQRELERCSQEECNMAPEELALLAFLKSAVK